MDNNRARLGQASAIDQDFADGFKYGCLLIEFEAVRARFELALQCGDTKLADQIAPQLTAAMKAVQESHATVMAKLQLIVDASVAKKERVN